jgi:C-terminal processing protease CtpA/Prc
MQQAEIIPIIDRAGRLVAERYLFPEVGAELADLLSARLAGGRYSRVDSPMELSVLVTEDLQSVNGDKHLRLRHHIEELPDAPTEDVDEELMLRIARSAMGGVARVERLAGNIGYVDLSPGLFPVSLSGPAIAAAMQLVAPANALIIDLRRNRGGDPATVALVCGYLFDEPVHLTDIYLREGDRTIQSWSLPYVPGARFGGDKPVFVLTGAETFSGAEELSYDLQQRQRATVVGERTGGGAHLRAGFRLHPHLELTVSTGRAINPVSGTNWEGTGVVPDVEVPAESALAAAHRRALDHVRQLDGDPALADEIRAALDRLAEPVAS